MQGHYREPSVIIGVDFDGTITEQDAYPNVANQRDNAIYQINRLYDMGYGIVINTLREGVTLGNAIEWMNENGLKYDWVNCNFPHLVEKFKSDARKISATIYVDDRNLGGLPHWDDIFTQIVKEHGRHIEDLRPKMTNDGKF